MADVLLPPWLNIARLRTDYLDNTGMTRGLYTRKPETTGFGGDGLRLSLEFVPTSSKHTPVERAAIRSFLASLRGRQNRAYLYDPSYRLRGSWPGGELLANGTFPNGTTGYAVSNAAVALSAADRRLRVKRLLNNSTNVTVQNTTSFAVTAFAPYVYRAMILAGRGSFAPQLRAADSLANLASATHTSASITTQGLHSFVVHPTATPFFFGVRDIAGTRIAGDFYDIAYASVSRCALVDNGQNLLLQSDELDTTWTPTRATVDDQAAGTTAPDGTSTADAIIGTAVSDTHLVSQAVTVSSATGDYVFGCALKAGARTFALLQLNESTSNHTLSCYFNLSTGAVGTASVSGGNWANARGFIVSLGDGWYACFVVGRKTNADTTLTARIYGAASDGSATYTGDGVTADIYAWRATLAQSSVAVRVVQTTTAASAGTDQTGSALHVKGLPASTSGLLLPDDRFEVITSRGSEMKIVTVALDSDAAGLGYLQFEPPLKGIPADNAPIIPVNPMTRAIFAGDMVGWDDSPGILTTASAEFEEAA